MPIVIGSHTYGSIVPRGDMNTITVGRYCSIGHGVIADGGFNHNSENISTYPFHAWGEPNRWPNNNVCRGDITIGSDVWIGEEALILSGVTVGNGAVIGARAIITKNVEPYTVVVGTNRVVKQRFTAREIGILQRLKWWDLPDDQVAAIVPYLHAENVVDLVKAIDRL